MQRRRCSRKGCDARVVGRKLCRRHYQAAWKRGTFVNEPLKPRTVARTICPPEHGHAVTRTCYVQHQCRCEPCRDGNTAAETRRRKAKAYGRYDVGLVDAAPVRAHMMVLAEFGIGYKQAAKIAGIGITPARTLIWGRQDSGPRNGELQKRVKRETAEKLLAVQPTIENMAAGAVVPALGTQRRIQALVTIGWSLSKLGARVGVNPSNMTTLLRQPAVTAKRHLDVAELFDELWDQLPPRAEWRDKIAYSRALSHAKARRWLPPLAWDDIDTDVEPPVAEPVEGAIDEVVVQLACAGERVRLSHGERREAITRLVAWKLSDPAIAERLHVADRTVWRIRQELGLAAPIGYDRQAAMSRPISTVFKRREGLGLPALNARRGRPKKNPAA